jgi:hypothetical protein
VLAREVIIVAAPTPPKKVGEQSIGRCMAEFLEASEAADLAAGKSARPSGRAQREAEVADLTQPLAWRRGEQGGLVHQGRSPPCLTRY